MLLPSKSTSSASCTLVTRATPATGFSDYSFSSGLLLRRSRRITSIFWLHCSVSLMLRWGLLPIYILVILWREHYAIYIGLRSKFELHTNCAPWCMRLCMVLRRSTSETCWPQWLNCLVARCCIWVILRAAHTNEIWVQVDLSCRTDSMECPATRAACSRWLACSREKLFFHFFSSRFMVLTLNHAN